MTTSTDENFVCSTATKNLVGHPKDTPVVDAGEKAIVEHFNTQLQRLHKHSYFTCEDGRKITYRDIQDVFVNGKSITSKLVDKIATFAILNPATGIKGGQPKTPEFLDSAAFIHALSRVSLKFEKFPTKDGFVFSHGLEAVFASSDGSGLFPSFVTTTDIYIPYHLGKPTGICISHN